MLCSHQPCPLSREAATSLSPLGPERFFSSPFGYFSTVSPGAVYSFHFEGRRKKPFGQQHHAQTSAALQLTVPSHLLSPSVHGWTSPGCLSHLPAQNTGSRVKQVPPSLTESLSANAPSRLCLQPVREAASVSWAGLRKFIFTTLANQMQGIQKYTFYMMACISHCLLSVKIPNWWCPGTCTLFLINIHSVTNELLDAVWQENIVNTSAQLKKCIVMERKNWSEIWDSCPLLTPEYHKKWLRHLSGDVLSIIP